MARKFLPGLRGLRGLEQQSTDLSHLVAPEGKSLTISGYSSVTDMASRSTVSYGSEGRADAWDMDTVISEGYERDVWVFRCVELVAGHAARLPFGAVRNRGKDNEERLESHPLYRVMNKRANPHEKAYAFRKRLSALLLLSKRGVFVEVIKSRAGAIVRLDLLDPARVRPVEDPNGDYVAYFEYTGRDGVIRDIEPSRIRWIREPHPTDPFSGVTPLEAAGMSVELDFLSRLYNNSFIKNDSRPGGILGVDTDTLSDQEMDRLERKMRPGAAHAGQLTVIGTGPGGLRYLDTTTKPRDMAYEHASSNSKNEILSAFGIGESLLGNAAGRTYDNAESELYSFWTTVMPPHLSLIASAFDEDLDEDWDPFFDTSGIEVLELPRRRDREEARNEVAQGLRTIDEYRPIAKLRPLDNAQTRALWVSPAKAPIPGRPEDAAELGLGGEGMPGADGGGMPPEGGGMPPEGGPDGGGTAADAVEEARAVEAGAQEAGGAAAAALADARQGTEGAGEPGAAAAAVADASQGYAGGQPGDAADAVREARRMMERKDGRLGFDVEEKRLSATRAVVHEAVRGLLSRQRAVITARVESPKARKGTRFWTPDGPTDTRGGNARFDVAKAVDADRWDREAFDAVAPIAGPAAYAAGTDLFEQLDRVGMVAGGSNPAATVTGPIAANVALMAGQRIADGMLHEVKAALDAAVDTAASVEDLSRAVHHTYSTMAPGLVDRLADELTAKVFSDARSGVLEAMEPAPGQDWPDLHWGSAGAFEVKADVAFLAPPS